MGLRNKFIILSSALCILLIAVTYFLPIRHTFLSLSILIILSFMVFVSVFDITIKKYMNSIKNPTQKLDVEEQSPWTDRVETTENASQLDDSEENIPDEEINFIAAKNQYDKLTALPTYEFCMHILGKTIMHAKRHKKIFAVLILELDNFQKHDLRLGGIADQILKQIGNRISNTLRAEDTIARYSNHKFIIILNDIGKPKFAASAAVKLLSAISHPFNLPNGETLQLTASIGVCIYPIDGEELAQLLKNAETALQIAQQAGGNVYEFHSKAIDSEAHEFVNIGQNLRKALSNNEMVLYYQPQLNIKLGHIIGVEALIRWKHPYHGILSPAKFIAVAEETGFIAELSEWALREACRINKYWQDEGYAHITVALNLSAKQFYLPDIADRIQKILQETGLHPKYLELEINEAAAMQNIELAVAQMQKLKSIGIQISLDHFGIGYTALSYLKLFPINTIKIDRSFIKGIPNQPNDCAITNALIALAHQLGYKAIAEGVETADQLAYLTEHDCDMIQGYYLGHPVSEQKIIKQLPKLPEKVLV